MVIVTNLAPFHDFKVSYIESIDENDQSLLISGSPWQTSVNFHWLDVPLDFYQDFRLFDKEIRRLTV